MGSTYKMNYLSKREFRNEGDNVFCCVLLQKVGHVARVRKIIHAYNISVGKPEGKWRTIWNWFFFQFT